MAKGVRIMKNEKTEKLLKMVVILPAKVNRVCVYVSMYSELLINKPQNSLYHPCGENLDMLFKISI